MSGVATQRRVKRWAFRELGEPPPGASVVVGFAARAVLLALTWHMNSAGVTWVSAETLAEGLEMSERTARRALNRLERAGVTCGLRRPGEPTVWTILVALTPDSVSGVTPDSLSGVSGSGPRTDPGQTPDSVTPEVGSREELQGQHPSPSSAEQRVEEGEEANFPNGHGPDSEPDQSHPAKGDPGIDDDGGGFDWSDVR